MMNGKERGKDGEQIPSKLNLYSLETTLNLDIFIIITRERGYDQRDRGYGDQGQQGESSGQQGGQDPHWNEWENKACSTAQGPTNIMKIFIL